MSKKYPTPTLLHPRSGPGETTPVSPARAWAAKEYRSARERCNTEAGAIQAVYAALPAELGCQDDLGTLTRWSKEDLWEATYQRQVAARERSEGVRERWSDVSAMARESKEVLDRILKELPTSDEATLGSGDVQRLRQAYQLWCEAQDRERLVEGLERKKVLERPADLVGSAEYDDLYRRLRGAYGDLGPQYDVLIHRLAEVEVRMRASRTSGRDMETTEYVGLHKLALDTINQLQKFTEAQKTELTRREVNDAVMGVLRIVERHLVSQPDKIVAIAQDIRRAASEKTA